MKDLNAYGNMTKTNLLINEFIKGYPENHSEEEESIVNEIKDRLGMNSSGVSFLEQSRQICSSLFISIDFRGMKITWNDMDESTIGPSYYPTDFGSCCLLVAHLDLEPIDENTTVEERYR